MVSKISQTLVVLFISAILISATGHAAEREVVAQSIEGQASYLSPGASEWVPLLEGQSLSAEDKIKSDSSSTLRLLFEGQADAWVEMRPGSEMTIKRVGSESTGEDTELYLMIGSVLVKAEKLKGDSKFEVHTPNSIVGIRGTVFEVNADR